MSSVEKLPDPQRDRWIDKKIVENFFCKEKNIKRSLIA